jgi:hypothetical protein
MFRWAFLTTLAADLWAMTLGTLDFGFELGLFTFWQCFETCANRVNEKLLAHRKAHGKRIEKCRLEGVAATPIGGEGRAEINQQFAD